MGYWNSRFKLFAVAMVVDLGHPDALIVLKRAYEKEKEISISYYGGTAADEPRTSACQRVRQRNLTGGELGAWQAGLKAVGGSPSPLAEAIRKIGFDVEFKLRPIDRLVIVSDGKDSCGKDACIALGELADSLEKKNHPVELEVVGKFACPEERERITKIEATSGELASGGTGKKKKLAKRGKSERKTRKSRIALSESGEKSTSLPSGTPSPWVGSALEAEGKKAPAVPGTIPSANVVTLSSEALLPHEESAVEKEDIDIKPLDPGESAVLVTGAPKEAQLELRLERGETSESVATWKGSSDQVVKPGTYDLSVKGWSKRPLRIQVGDQQRKEVVFYRDLELISAEVIVRGPPLDLDFDPMQSQPKAKRFQIKKEARVRLAPGTWRVSLYKPRWLSKIEPIKLTFLPGQVVPFQKNDAFGDRIVYIDPPLDVDAILVFKTEYLDPTTEQKKQREEEIYIPRGSPRIPLPKNGKWELYEAEAQE